MWSVLPGDTAKSLPVLPVLWLSTAAVTGVSSTATVLLACALLAPYLFRSPCCLDIATPSVLLARLALLNSAYLDALSEVMLLTAETCPYLPPILLLRCSTFAE